VRKRSADRWVGGNERSDGHSYDAPAIDGHDVQFNIVYCSSRHRGEACPMAPRTMRAYFHGPGTSDYVAEIKEVNLTFPVLCASLRSHTRCRARGQRSALVSAGGRSESCTSGTEAARPPDLRLLAFMTSLSSSHSCFHPTISVHPCYLQFEPEI
jgi:hypothetical protein